MQVLTTARGGGQGMGGSMQVLTTARGGGQGMGRGAGTGGRHGGRLVELDARSPRARHLSLSKWTSVVSSRRVIVHVRCEMEVSLQVPRPHGRSSRVSTAITT
jgi:hypothetical protein